MSRVRSNSSPELIPSLRDLNDHDGSPLEGVSTNLGLLMKLIQDHNDASKEDDSRNAQRVAGMITILDEVKSQIQKSQLPKKPKLQRCSSENRRLGGAPPRKPHVDTVVEENHKLRQELSASIVAQRSLGKMFSSLGKEKEIMATELARKARELEDMEELIGDLREQNERLAEKVKICKTQHYDALSEQQLLIESLDGFWIMKRALKSAHEEKMRLKTKVAETAGAGIGRIHSAFERICRGREGPKEVLVLF